MIEKPRVTPYISTGNLITIFFGFVTAAGMFFMMDARSQNNADDIVALMAEVESHDDKINDLYLTQARSDERFNSILELLSRIDQRLEKIEALQ